MKARHTAVWIGSLVLLLAFTGLAHGEATPDSIELAALIESLLVDEGETATLRDWSWGSDTKDPIAWQHAGIEEVPKADPAQNGMYRRRGDVVVTVEDQVTHHVLAEKTYPGRWNVTLRGPRGGWTSVVIESDVYSADLCSLSLESLAEGLSFVPYKCKNEPATGGTPVYIVRKTGKKPAWLRNEYSGGSAGCSQTYELFFDQAKADRVQCWGDE